MTVDGIPLRTHQDDTVLSDAFSYPLEPFLESRKFGDPRVISPVSHITCWFHPPRTQFLSQEDVGDLRLPQIGCEQLLVELGMVPRVRAGSNIHQGGDMVAAEESQEVEDRVVGMPDSEEFLCHHGSGGEGC